ncbi:corticotropin-releasing factor receptor 2-like isoform X2 [Tachypleus tridentatus]|uniref:corticotropin-releasing factor receptor 2-like isoform X2 n=1 Tax=Tachypleus tridentatus TaxID=6853 RepID=UPI003FD66C0E
MGNMFENQTILSTIAVQALDDFSGVDGFDSKQPNFDEPKKISGQPSPKEMAIILCQLQYQNTVHTEGPSCPTIWDDFYCWPATLADHIVSRNCSEIFNQHSLPVDINIMGEARAYRICDQNGDWLWGNWTNYTECLQLLSQDSRDFSSSQVAVTYILFVCSLVSLVALFLTLFIFCYFKSLQCSRLRVHRNLVVALIIHSVLLVIISSPGVLQARYLSYVDINWLCKTILSLKMYAAMASINWMFVEGLLLHSRITISVFNKDAPFKLYYMIGWGPMIAALLINTVFLVNIVRILVTKLRMSVSIETTQVRRAIKATALLFPLLGITHLLFCINPRDDAHLERAYMISNAILQSSQGIFVAVLYCFLNSEVQTVLRNAYLRAILQRDPNHHLTRRRGLSRTSASYLSNCDTSVSDSARHKVAPSVNVMVPLHEMSQQEEHRGRKQLKFLKTNSERQRIFSI